MVEPVYGFNEADAHNLVRLIRNDRADLTETPFLQVSYTNIYIAQLTTGFTTRQLEPFWSVSAANAYIFDLKNNILNTVEDTAVVIDPLSIFSDDLERPDRLYCVPFEANYFLALQAPCGS